MKHKKVVTAIVILLALVGFSYYENNSIKVASIDFRSKDLPKSYNGYKILQLSDLHNKLFGKNQKDLVSKIKKAKPDIVVITGDLVDSNHYNEETSLKLINELQNIAPIYFVTGNHERLSEKFPQLEVNLKEMGVLILRNESVKLERSGEGILLMGIDDPMFSDVYEKTESTIVEEEIKKALYKEGQSGFKILLSHRPEQFPVYVKQDIDLIFSGHAHGGQVRLPIVGGLVAPNQGYFPKYTSGIYFKESSAMIVSRGLGNSIIPQRLFNRPEIVVVTLRSK